MKLLIRYSLCYSFAQDTLPRPRSFISNFFPQNGQKAISARRVLPIHRLPFQSFGFVKVFLVVLVTTFVDTQESLHGGHDWELLATTLFLPAFFALYSESSASLIRSKWERTPSSEVATPKLAETPLPPG